MAEQTEQKPSGQYIVVEKPREKVGWEITGNILWKGSAENFHRGNREVVMRRGIVYISLENPDGTVVKRIRLNRREYNPHSPRPPRQLGFKL